MKTVEKIVQGYLRRTDDGLHYLTIEDAIKAAKKYHAQFQPPVVSDEEIEHKIYGIYGSHNDGDARERAFISGAKWMRDKLTAQ